MTKLFKAQRGDYFKSVAANEVPSHIISKIVTVEFARMGTRTTVCLLKLEGGYEIVGTSVRADPTDFDELREEHLAAKDALRKLEKLDEFLRHTKKQNLNYEE
jgi:hypothetical protein